MSADGRRLRLPNLFSLRGIDQTLEAHPISFQFYDAALSAAPLVNICGLPGCQSRTGSVGGLRL